MQKGLDGIPLKPLQTALLIVKIMRDNERVDANIKAALTLYKKRLQWGCSSVG